MGERGGGQARARRGLEHPRLVGDGQWLQVSGQANGISNQKSVVSQPAWMWEKPGAGKRLNCHGESGSARGAARLPELITPLRLSGEREHQSARAAPVAVLTQVEPLPGAERQSAAPDG